MAKPSVLIVGGGVFGTSTAYHLSLRGYDSVTVLDRFSTPSKDSAATDLNKVVRADYPNPLYARLGEEAMLQWKDPASIFAGMYRETGWVMSGHGMTRGWLHSALDTARRAGREGVAFIETEDMKKRWPALTGDFPDWTNLWSPAAGWVASGQAVLRMAKAARAQGVKYVTGDVGYIKKLLYDDDGTCKGAVAADGTIHEADLVVLTTGANTASLVEASKEVVAQTSVICVMKLEPHEIEKYKDIPIIDDFEQGIIFPPDDNGLIKLCSVRLITNYQNNKVAGASVLHSLGDYPDDGCPKEIEDEMRSFVREIIPELADRPFISTKLCWDGIASDLNFRVCPYPDTRNLFVATVGSNHGFKFLPIIGKYVADMLEGNLGKDLRELWAWKNGQVPEGTQDPHPWPRRDLSDLSGWRGRNAPGAGKLPWTWSRLLAAQPAALTPRKEAKPDDESRDPVMKRLPSNSIRSAVACQACHKQKLKCNGGTPCQRCQTRNRSCVYPVREKFIMVHESYLQNMELELKDARLALQQSGPAAERPRSETIEADVPDFAAPLSPPRTGRAVKEEASGDCGSVHFCQELEDLSRTDNSRSPQSGTAKPYTYSKLKFDFIQPEVSFRLPPRPYALLLLEAFEEGFSEYHWFLRESFKERLFLTYSDPVSQSHDRNWLCRVSVVLALAESFNRSRMTPGTYMSLAGQGPPSPYAALPPQTVATATSYPGGSPPADEAPLPPGSDFFEQGLMLLKMSSEEPVPEDVEALNLIALYCYSLNRRKTAYSYASQSVALAKLLQLHKPINAPESDGNSGGSRSRMLDEHRKRLWWTSYCIDRMTSTELGVAPAFSCVPEGMQLPSSAGLAPEEAEQFSDPSLLTATAQLCEIKRDVVRTAAQHGGSEERLDAIQASLDMLQQWRAGLPAAMDFTFEDNLPKRLMESRHGRILASIYLRYHQCFILLLRPIYLQKLSMIVQKRRQTSQSAAASPNVYCNGTSDSEGDPMAALKMQCLQAARNNCKILLGLWSYDKIAKFGYWESLHLFSGLAILALAQVSIDSDLASPTDEDDSALYSQTRQVLGEMARAGNPAAKDHDVLLSDVEAMAEKVSKEKAAAELAGMEFDLSGEFDGSIDFSVVDQWCEQDFLGGPQDMANFFIECTQACDGW